jgi:hypothetical protein
MKPSAQFIYPPIYPLKQLNSEKVRVISDCEPNKIKLPAYSHHAIFASFSQQFCVVFAHRKFGKRLSLVKMLAGLSLNCRNAPNCPILDVFYQTGRNQSAPFLHQNDGFLRLDFCSFEF